jgi:hypothetical protein
MTRDHIMDELNEWKTFLLMTTFGFLVTKIPFPCEPLSGLHINDLFFF